MIRELNQAIYLNQCHLQVQIQIQGKELLQIL